MNTLKDRLLLNPLKAGTSLDGIENIKETIYRASEVLIYFPQPAKGSAFFINEQRKDAEIEKQVAEMVDRFNHYKNLDLSVEASIVAAQAQKLDRSFDRWIVHIDMDAFYAAVEELERPDLKWKPMAVGGPSMLCTANYEARKYGVRSAMPGYIAKKLCPDLVIIEPHFDKYQLVSRAIRAVLENYDQNYKTVSLDEAYLDLTSFLDETQEDVEEVVKRIREEIFDATRVTASAGIAHNVMLSKVCSDMNKPNGQYLLERNEVAVSEFLRKLPIRKVPGIGRVLERILNGIEIKYCSDLKPNLVYLFKLFSPKTFGFLMNTAFGVASNFLEGSEQRKSMSVENTFSTMTDEKEMFSKIHQLSETLSKDLQTEDLKGKTVTLKLKTSQFQVMSRSWTSDSYVWRDEHICSIAQSLLKEELKKTNLSLRLIGIRVSNFKSTNEGQISKFLIKPDSDVNVEPFVCPICSIKIFSKNELVLSDHVLACSSTSSGSAVEPKRKKSKKSESITDHFPRQKASEFFLECPVCNITHDFKTEREMYQHVHLCIDSQSSTTI